MPLMYAYTAIHDAEVPVASEPLVQHALDTYASETNKVVSVWREFRDEDLGFRPHARASTVGDIFKHQLLSERRFFGEFLGTPGAGKESSKIGAGLGSDDERAGQPRRRKDQGQILSEGMGTTNWPPQARMRPIWLMISSRRFQGRIRR